MKDGRWITIAELQFAHENQGLELHSDNACDDRPIARLPDDASCYERIWACTSANRTLQAALPKLVDPRQRIKEKSLGLLPGISVQKFQEAVGAVELRDPLETRVPFVGSSSRLQPAELPTQSLGARIGDLEKVASLPRHGRLIRRGG